MGWQPTQLKLCALAVALGVGVFASLSPTAAQMRTIEDLLEGIGIYADPPEKPNPETAPVGAQSPNNGEGLPKPPTRGGPSIHEAYGPPPPLAPVTIRWQLSNPFRFFTDPALTDIHRRALDRLTPAQQRNSPILASERVLSRKFDFGWAADMVAKSCWDPETNRYRCKKRKDYLSPKSHKVRARLEGFSDSSISCTWRAVPLEGKESAATVRKRCVEGVELAIPYPSGARLSVEVGGQEIAKETVKVEDLLIVGMGDSFGSGEGNPDIPVELSPTRAAQYGKSGGASLSEAGYPVRAGPWREIGDAAFVKGSARWLDQACHRSLYSYSTRVALQLALEDPHRAVTYVGLACSGAEVTFGLFLRYKGHEWVPNPPDLSQISAAADAQCGDRKAELKDMPEAYHIRGAIPELKGGLVLKKCPAKHARKIDLLLLSIGGNDIGFARLIANAVLDDDSLIRSLGGWFGQVHGNKRAEELLKRLDERYKAMNRAIHGILHIPWTESDRVLLTAYPPLAMVDDRGKVCQDGNAGMDVYKDFSVTEQRALSSAWLADKLNTIMGQSARSHAWTFVDAHQKAFVGHGMCAGHTTGLGKIADDLRMPRRIADDWEPYNPIHFRAYASRKRWFRTPNDAFMTGNFHVGRSVLSNVLDFDSLAWFQVLLAATYSGAFHPSAEGQAAIADATLLQARRVLKKYGQAKPFPPPGGRAMAVDGLSRF